MKEKLDFYRVVCNECRSAVVVYVPFGHDPILNEELAGYKIYPRKSDRNNQYHLCPTCQKAEPKLTVIPGDKA